MSKQTKHLISGLQRRLHAIKRDIDEMENNVGILNKEADPEAYLRWYLSYHSVRNLEGRVTEALERIEAYNNYKNLPWWKRLFRRIQ